MTLSRQRRGSQRDRLQLNLLPGDEYLGSIEPQSLQVLTYCKLARVPIEIHSACLPWKSPSWTYPAIKQGNKLVSRSVDDIITAIKDMGFNIDRSQSDQILAETVAYSSFLSDRLLPALSYIRWLDTQNYMEVTSGQYGKLMQFPFSTFYLSWRYRSTHQVIMRGTNPESSLEQIGLELQSRAEEGITLLSSRLGDKPFFNGDCPSSLDALVFGYLEVILQTPLPASNLLYRHIHSTANLLQFCFRIRARAFPDKKLKMMTVVPVKTTIPLWRDPKVWLSVGLAALLLGVQAARVGLLARLASSIAARRHQ